MKLTPAIILSLLVLSACQPSPTNTHVGSIKSDQYCSIEGLSPPLRQTVVVIDARELHHTDSPQNARAINGPVIDAVNAIATQGLSPRERLKIILTPADGMQPKLLFSGCLPGFSSEELKSRSSVGGGAAKTLLGQNDSQKAAEALDTFNRLVLNSVGAAINETAEGTKSDAGIPFISASMIQSLHNGAGLIDLDEGIPRVFLLSNLARFDLGSPSDPVEARKAGFAAAASAGLNLSRSELHVMLVKSGSAFAHEFASAFFLGSQAWLADWGKDLPSNLPNPPVKAVNYTGTLDYGNANFAIQARLATDRNGVLVNSWVVLQHDTERAVPLTGSLICSEAQSCTLTQDSLGFAQVWSPKLGVGPKPDFSPDLPFAGLRTVELTTSNGKARGRVTDPSVSQIGDKSALEFQLNECERCRL